MSTAAMPPRTAEPAAPREIVVYSHSTLFYWWPVWAAGFIMGAISFFSGQRLAIVPAGTHAETQREQAWLKSADPKDDVRDILVLPKEKHLAKDKADNVETPHLRISSNKNLGVLFCTVLLVVVFITNVPLRGLWSVIVIGLILFLSIIFALVTIRERTIWDHILSYLSILDIRINAAGYIFISVVLFILWLIITRLFDRQIYMVFTPGQCRVRLEIGEGETAYDTTGMTIQKQRSDLFRHVILGFGSGDLIVKTSGAQAHTFDLPNVLSLGRRVTEIEDMLRSRAVVSPG
jgi:hypothetical protein